MLSGCVINKCESARLQLMIGLVPQLWAQLWSNQRRRTCHYHPVVPQSSPRSWHSAIFPTFTPILSQSSAKLGHPWIGMVASPNFSQTSLHWGNLLCNSNSFSSLDCKITCWHFCSYLCPRCKIFPASNLNAFVIIPCYSTGDKTRANFGPYLIIVTGATGAARVIFFCPV